MKKITVLYSSGLDSKIMLHLARHDNPDAEITCVYYAHGAESEEQEIARLPEHVAVRRIDWLGDVIKPRSKPSEPANGSIYIPGRNLVFAALAASQELCNEVWLGTMVNEDNPRATDKNSHFRKHASELLSYVLSPFVNDVRVVFPFVDRGWAKLDSVAWALSHGMTQQDLLSSTSCWHHVGQPCGACKMCFYRWMVFKLNGIEEACAQHPIDSDSGHAFLETYLAAVYVRRSTNQDDVNVVQLIHKCYDAHVFAPDVMQMVRHYSTAYNDIAGA